jgi:Peptidase family M28
MIYDKIYDFCKVRNHGNCFKNGTEPTPRVKFLMNLLDEQQIEYELDIFSGDEDSKRKPLMFVDNGVENKYFNIIMKGSSNKMIVAHHDVNNASTDNANDNSASVINVIATKKLRPELNVVLLDGEEFGGIGSNRVAQQIKSGEFGKIDWVLNYELTGKGGKYFFIGDYPGPLSDRIKGLFSCPVVRTPFNDSVIFRRHGIDSTVINPVPALPEGKKSEVVFPDGTNLDISILYNCHSPKDTVSSISVSDMKEFVEEVILKIV